MINEPSLNIDGLRSEDVGRQSRTIIPSEATATVDLRLVKGIEPRRQVERLIAHIRSRATWSPAMSQIRNSIKESADRARRK